MDGNSTIKEAKTGEEIEKCWLATKELRTHLIENEFVARVQNQMKTDGYRLIYIEENGKVASILGFRVLNTLYAGKVLFIDDLSCLPEFRRKGFGGALLDYIKEYAKKENFASVRLDSGFQRHHAHRLYLNKGFILHFHHFVLDL